MRLIEELFLAHHLQLADALIAATAIEHKLAIVTSNTRHFSVRQNTQDRSIQAPLNEQGLQQRAPYGRTQCQLSKAIGCRGLEAGRISMVLNSQSGGDEYEQS